MGIRDMFSNVAKTFSVKQSALDTKITALEKIERITKAVEANRPHSADLYYGTYGTTPYKQFPWQLYIVYEMARYSDVLTGMHRALRTEAFRNGIEIAPAKATDSDVETSDDQGEIDEKEINRRILFVKKFFEKVNKNGQSLKDVFKELEDDINIIDDQYMFLKFAYILGPDGEIETKELREVLRVNPINMTKVLNKDDEPARDDDGNLLLSGILSRDKLRTVNSEDESSVTIKFIDKEKRYFDIDTGERLYEVFYKDLESEEYYYFEWEFVYNNRYRPSKRHGMSPIITGWLKINTLYHEDDYIHQWYVGKRPPKGGLFFNTANSGGIKKAWDSMIERAKKNPHLPSVMNIPPAANDTRSGGKFVEFIDFMKSLEEMQYTEQRKEYRNAIGFMYGVSPVLANDTSTSGGLNNEGLQYTVTNRAVEDNQDGYNTKNIKAILWGLGVEGISAFLRPSEEQDKAALLDRKMKSLTVGRQAVEVGLSVTWDKELEDVKIDDGELVAPVSDMGGFGGEFGNPFETPETNTEISGTPEKVEKAVPKQGSTFGSGQLSKAMDEIINKFFKKYKRMPSKKELEGRLQKIQTRMTIELKSASLPFFMSTYKRALGQVESEMRTQIGFGDIDKQAVEDLMSDPKLSKAYKGLTDDVTKKINNLITEAYETPQGLNQQQLTKRIQEISGVAESRAATIARTETSKVSNAARRNSYLKLDPEDTFKYIHIGPPASDPRTTQTSINIMKRTANGVSWDDYVRIIKEESAKEFPEWTVKDDAPVSHYNSRHTFKARRQQ